MSYDERQISAPLCACQRCGRTYYMHGLICVRCGPGWRTVQDPPPSRLDVNHVEMIDP
jgi:hypothetical protein